MSEAAEEECSICIGPFSKRAPRVECAYCHGAACQGCVQRYLLGAGLQPTCLFPECRLPWSQEFLDANTGKTWRLNDLKKARERFLYEMEQAKLPDTQEIAAAYLAAKKVLEENEEAVRKAKAAVDAHPIVTRARECEERQNRARSDYTRLDTQLALEYDTYRVFLAGNIAGGGDPAKGRAERIAKLVEEKRAANERLNQAQADAAAATATDAQRAELKKLQTALNRAKRGATKERARELRVARICVNSYGLVRDGLTPGEPAMRRQFIRACPQTDCRGFLSTAWKCGLCEIHVCSKCHDPKKAHEDPEHTCEDEKVETAKALAKETRPCPKCAAAIFKIDGCDQIWCTNCQTAFSWRTGQISQGRVHNPHYYEWMRRNGQAIPVAGDTGDPCGDPGRLPAWPNFLQRAPSFYKGVAPRFGPVLRYGGTGVLLPYNGDTAFRNLSPTFAFPETKAERQEGEYIFAVWMAWATLEAMHMTLTHMVTERNQIPQAPEDDTVQLRVQFLAGELTQEQFSVALQRKHKAWRKNEVTRALMDMFVTAGSDTMRAFLIGEQSLTTVLISMDALLKYYTAEATRESANFNTIVRRTGWLHPSGFSATWYAKFLEDGEKAVAHLNDALASPRILAATRAT